MYRDLLIILAPLLISFSVSSVCSPSKNAGMSVKFRPPAFVFGIVWPILYLLLGVAWVKSKQYSLYYITLICLLNLWLVVYSCYNNKKAGIYIILLSILSLLYILILVNRKIKFYLLPLFIWLLFALLLNTFEVQYK
tara:strand:+ start:2165 stop:2575 length:411 start_codon:yes stop_codon:yes gene_type:complete